MKGRPLVFCVCILVLIYFEAVQCDFFSSVHEVTKLIDHERVLLTKMEKFVALNEKRLDYIKEKLYKLEKDHEISENALASPVQNYLVTKRLLLDWDRLDYFLNHEVGTNILESIDTLRKKCTFPGEDDVNGAIEGMLRLQQIYRLNTTDMVQGILGGVKYATELSAKDCYDFGRFALKEGNLLFAHSWLVEALDRFESYEPTEIDAKFEKPDVVELLAEVKFKLGDFDGAGELAYALSLMCPNEPRLLELYSKYNKYSYTRESTAIGSEHEPIPSDLSMIDDALAFRLTCSEHIRQPPSYDSQLHCRYVTKNHPFLQIAPLKLEEIHFDPKLVLYHDVIYESEIEKVIQLANDYIEQSRVNSINGSIGSRIRTSQYVVFPKDADKVLRTMDQRLADMTGLDISVSEDHQVSNYGIGGHYSQHYDFFTDPNAIKADRFLANRVATILFYLTDVEQGGGTAFPVLKRVVKPKKGAAAFWYNLHASGDGDSRTRHGGCPVLVGSKSVLNRCIGERGQDFKRPCGLTNDAVETSVRF